MKNAIWLLLLLAGQLFGDVVLYDEPQISNYDQIGQKKPPTLPASVIETCSYNNPDTGFACIEGTGTSNTSNGGSKFSIMLAGGWIDPTEFTALRYRVRQKTVNAGRMDVHCYTGGAGGQVGKQATVGQPVGSYGLNAQNITSYQTITIPMSAFVFPAGTVVNRVTWDMVITNSGFYIDGIVLVGSGIIHRPDPYPPATSTPTPTP